MPIPLGSPLPPAPPPGRRRSLVKRMFRGAGWLSAGPMDWAGTGRVRRGWSLIGDLAAILRAGPGRDQRFKTEDCGVFDARATAFSYGVSVPQLEQRLLARRRQTARIAYTTFALGWLFLAGWLLRALGSRSRCARSLPWACCLAIGHSMGPTGVGFRPTPGCDQSRPPRRSRAASSGAMEPTPGFPPTTATRTGP